MVDALTEKVKIYALSNLFVRAGLSNVSTRQHEYFLGEKLNHEIPPIEAHVDWSFKGWQRWFNQRFETNRAYIYDYVQEKREEITVEGGLPRFTEAQFDHLIIEDHSNYKRKDPEPSFAA
ncbi:MAG: hypothetical protein WCK29_03695 [archaeon]